MDTFGTCPWCQEAEAIGWYRDLPICGPCAGILSAYASHSKDHDSGKVYLDEAPGLEVTAREEPTVRLIDGGTSDG